MTNAPADDDSPLWQFIRLQDFSRPPGVPTEAVRKGVTGLLERLRPPKKNNSQEFSTPDLSAVPGSLLDQIVPTTDVDTAADALETALSARNFPQPSVFVVVGAPCSATGRIIETWAARRGWPILDPPKADTLCLAENPWTAGLAASGPLVISRLEHCFLRHANGLEPFRRLMAMIAGRNETTVLGCDSWAWAYLTRAASIDRLFPEALTLAPFDAQRLGRYLRPNPFRGKMLHFRQADNGRPVLPRQTNSEETQNGENATGREQNPTDFLLQLAHTSMGNPAVAAAIWRHSLQSIPDAADRDPLDGSTLWVRPWSQVKRPGLPKSPDASDLFVLHHLLIHGGLPKPILSQLMPFPFRPAVHSLQRLEEAGLIHHFDGRWQVSPSGYPAIRQHIVNEGYLWDGL
jgi:hypothetical protein